VTDPADTAATESEPTDSASADTEPTDSAPAESAPTEPGQEAGTEATGPTGHPVVDATVARLADQAELPPAEQVPGYEAVHRALQQTLASIDQS
jgi:hypothetical protein